MSGETEVHKFLTPIFSNFGKTKSPHFCFTSFAKRMGSKNKRNEVSFIRNKDS